MAIIGVPCICCGEYKFIVNREAVEKAMALADDNPDGLPNLAHVCSECQTVLTEEEIENCILTRELTGWTLRAAIQAEIDTQATLAQIEQFGVQLRYIIRAAGGGA